MTDREALNVLIALADEPFPRLQEGARVRWTGVTAGATGPGPDDGTVVERSRGWVGVRWDDRAGGDVISAHLVADKLWLENLWVLP